MSIITSSSGGSGGQNGFSGSSRQLFNADPEDTELEKLKQDLTYFKQEIEREGNQEVRITILERIARTEERILALMECQNQHYRQLNMNMKLALETARKSHDVRFNDQANNDKNK